MEDDVPDSDLEKWTRGGLNCVLQKVMGVSKTGFAYLAEENHSFPLGVGEVKSMAKLSKQLIILETNLSQYLCLAKL